MAFYLCTYYTLIIGIFLVTYPYARFLSCFPSHILIVLHLFLCPLFFPDLPHMRENTQYICLHWNGLFHLTCWCLVLPIFLQMASLQSFLCLRKCITYGHQFLYLSVGWTPRWTPGLSLCEQCCSIQSMQVDLLYADFTTPRSGKAESCGPLHTWRW